MKVSTGLVVVALAVTSSHADNSNNLRSPIYDAIPTDSNPVAHDLDESKTQLTVDLTNLAGSDIDNLDKFNIMKVIGEGKNQVSIEDIIEAYQGELDSSSQNTESDDDDSLLSSKPKDKSKNVNVKGNDIETENSEDSDSKNADYPWESNVKTGKSAEFLPSDDPNGTNVKESFFGYQGKGTGEDQQGFTNVKTGKGKEFLPTDDIVDSKTDTTDKDSFMDGSNSSSDDLLSFFGSLEFKNLMSDGIGNSPSSKSKIPNLLEGSGFDDSLDTLLDSMGGKQHNKEEVSDPDSLVESSPNVKKSLHKSDDDKVENLGSFGALQETQE